MVPDFAGKEARMTDPLFRYFSPRVIVDAYPSHFVFSRPAKDFRFSVEPFVYMAKKQDEWLPASVGEEIPEEELRKDATLTRVEIFALDQSIQFGCFGREELIEVLVEFGIGMCFVKSIIPPLRPVVHFFGADRFRDKFENPREIFEKALKQGGAGIVAFDQMDL